MPVRLATWTYSRRNERSHNVVQPVVELLLVDTGRRAPRLGGGGAPRQASVTVVDDSVQRIRSALSGCIGSLGGVSNGDFSHKRIFSSLCLDAKQLGSSSSFVINFINVVVVIVNINNIIVVVLIIIVDFTFFLFGFLWTIAIVLILNFHTSFVDLLLLFPIGVDFLPRQSFGVAHL